MMFSVFKLMIKRFKSSKLFRPIKKSFVAILNNLGKHNIFFMISVSIKKTGKITYKIYVPKSNANQIPKFNDIILKRLKDISLLRSLKLSKNFISYNKLVKKLETIQNFGENIKWFGIILFNTFLFSNTFLKDKIYLTIAYKPDLGKLFLDTHKSLYLHHNWITPTITSKYLITNKNYNKHPQQSDIILLAKNPLGGNIPITGTDISLNKHTILTGQTGMGKSKLMYLLIRANLKLGHKVIIFDPHSEYAKPLSNFNPFIVDLSNPKTSINILPNGINHILLSAEHTKDIFIENLPETNARLNKLIKYILIVLYSINQATITNLYTFISDSDYRESILNNAQNLIPTPVYNFLTTKFIELETTYYDKTIAKLINLLDELILLPTFTNSNAITPLNFKDIISKNQLTIIDLNSNTINLTSRKLITGLITTQLFLLSINNIFLKPTILATDEAKNVQNLIFSKILAEGRKFNLFLYLSFQYLNQLNQDLQESIISNVSNYFLFKTNKDDANVYAKNLTYKIWPESSDDNEQVMLKKLKNLNIREIISCLSLRNKTVCIEAKTKKI